MSSISGKDILIKYFNARLTVLFLLSALIVILPFVKDFGYPDDNETSKISLFVFVMFALFPFTILSLFIGSKNTLSIKYIDILLLSYWLMVLVYMIVAGHASLYSFSFYEWIALGLLYVSVRGLNSFIPVYAIAISATVQSIYGLLQLYGFADSNHGIFKITGGFYNPAPLSGFLAPAFILCIGLYLTSENSERTYRLRWRVSNFFERNFKGLYLYIQRLIKYVLQYKYFVLAITLLLVIPATKSRAAWLGNGYNSFFAEYMNYQADYFVDNQSSKYGALADNIQYP